MIWMKMLLLENKADLLSVLLEFMLSLHCRLERNNMSELLMRTNTRKHTQSLHQLNTLNAEVIFSWVHLYFRSIGVKEIGVREYERGKRDEERLRPDDLNRITLV